jgi:hypothetical protein
MLRRNATRARGLKEKRNSKGEQFKAEKARGIGPAGWWGSGEEARPAVTKSKEEKKTKKKRTKQRLAAGDDVPVFDPVGKVNPKHL